jgi:Holliday junction resolvase RusA-like endonuclease
VIRLFVLGVPKALSVGKAIRTGGGRSFQKKINSEWATLVGHEARAHAPTAPLEGAVAVMVRFYMPRPTSAPKRAVLPLKRPDVDNLVHKLTDQLNGVFWKDDSQVLDLIVSKRYDRDEPQGRCGVELSVWPLEAPALFENTLEAAGGFDVLALRVADAERVDRVTATVFAPLQEQFRLVPQGETS